MWVPSVGRSCWDPRQPLSLGCQQDILKFLFTRVGWLFWTIMISWKCFLLWCLQGQEMYLWYCSALWKEVFISRPLFISRNVSAVPFPHNRYSPYAWSWMAGSARPFFFTWGAHWCTDGLTEQTCILSMHSLRSVPCTNTTLPVILDYLLETKVVCLPFYFLRFTW